MKENLDELWKNDEAEEKLDELIKCSNNILDKLNALLVNEKQKDASIDMDEKENIDKKCFTYKFKGKDAEYEPDSSSVAWKYYDVMYNNTIPIEENKKYEGDGNYYRVKGSFSYYKGEKGVIIDSIIKGDKRNSIDLAGDCVFNFKKEIGNDGEISDKCKYYRFKEMICKNCRKNKKGLESCHEKECDQYNMLLELEYCNEMLHSPYNFALMPVTGGMNLSKGNYLDRPDRLLCGIEKFYAKNPKEELVEEYKKDIKHVKAEINSLQEDNFRFIQCREDSENDIWLFDFLCKINNVKKYAKIFYNLDDAEDSLDKILLERMLETGKHDIVDSKDVENYMHIAILYWNIQRYKYEKQKNKEERRQLEKRIDIVRKYWERKEKTEGKI